MGQPFAGAVADRFDLRRLVITTQSVSGVLAAVLWGLAATGRASVGAVGVAGGWLLLGTLPLVGVVLGLAAVVSGTLGDLGESLLDWLDPYRGERRRMRWLDAYFSQTTIAA